MQIGMGSIHCVGRWHIGKARALLHDKGNGSLGVLYACSAGPGGLHAPVQYICAAIASGQIAKFEQRVFCCVGSEDFQIFERVLVKYQNVSIQVSTPFSNWMRRLSQCCVCSSYQRTLLPVLCIGLIAALLRVRVTV